MKWNVRFDVHRSISTISIVQFYVRFSLKLSISILILFFPSIKTVESNCNWCNQLIIFSILWLNWTSFWWWNLYASVIKTHQCTLFSICPPKEQLWIAYKFERIFSPNTNWLFKLKPRATRIISGAAAMVNYHYSFIGYNFSEVLRLINCLCVCFFSSNWSNGNE